LKCNTEYNLLFLTLIPLSGVDTTSFSLCCDKDSATIFTTGRLPDVNPPWRNEKLEWMLTTADAAGTNSLTCRPKHGKQIKNIYFLIFIV
jgi:hypothetical protein